MCRLIRKFLVLLIAVAITFWSLHLELKFNVATYMGPPSICVVLDQLWDFCRTLKAMISKKKLEKMNPWLDRLGTFIVSIAMTSWCLYIELKFKTNTYIGVLGICLVLDAAWDLIKAWEVRNNKH